jgi:glycosyltransferase involved in cell wall biosynthesis
MSLRVCTVLETLGHLGRNIPDMQVHGANLIISAQLRLLLSDERVDALEVFLPPTEMIEAERLAAVAEETLPPHRRGRGALRFYPVQTLPEVFAREAVERAFFCIDPHYSARDRYLRDRFAQAPTVLSIDTHSLGQYRLWPTVATYARAGHVAYDVLACISEELRLGFARAFAAGLSPDGKPPLRLELLPHPVDHRMFRPVDANTRSWIRQMLGLPVDQRLYVNFGRISSHHKADLVPVIDAFLEAELPRAVLVIMGEENTKGYCQHLRRYARERGGADRVFVRGPIPPETRPLAYAIADVFVFPSDTVQEALGNTMLEAMATGLPVLANDWDGMKMGIAPGETGWRVPTRLFGAWEDVSALAPAGTLMTDYLLMSQTTVIDVPALTQAFRESADEELCRKMGGRGREIIEAQYTPEVWLDRFLELQAHSLELARREPLEVREKRRREAPGWAYALPLDEVFTTYGTGTVAPDARLELTAFGRQVREGRVELPLYGETRVLVHPAVLEVLFALATAPITWSDLVAATARQSGFAESAVRWHAALAVKKGTLTWVD